MGSYFPFSSSGVDSEVISEFILPIIKNKKSKEVCPILRYSVGFVKLKVNKNRWIIFRADNLLFQEWFEKRIRSALKHMVFFGFCNSSDPIWIPNLLNLLDDVMKQVVFSNSAMEKQRFRLQSYTFAHRHLWCKHRGGEPINHAF